MNKVLKGCKGVKGLIVLEFFVVFNCFSFFVRFSTCFLDSFRTIFGQIFAQNFGEVFDQIFGQGFDQGFGGGKKNHKYSVQYYPA